jgi:hypothetical protein
MRRSDSQHVGAIEKRWSKVIYWVLFGLPFIMLIGMVTLLIIGKPSGQHCAIHAPPQIFEGIGAYAEEAVGMLLLCGAFALTFDWPFLVFANEVKKRIRARWPDVNIHWAAAGALIGLSVPYVLFYIFLAYTSADFWLRFGPLSIKGAVETYLVSLYFWLIFLVPSVGATLGLMGWLIGWLAYEIACLLKIV